MRVNSSFILIIYIWITHWTSVFTLELPARKNQQQIKGHWSREKHYSRSKQKPKSQVVPTYINANDYKVRVCNFVH